MPEISRSRRAAERYIERGLAPIPIPSGSKNPGRKGWQGERHTLEDVPRLWTNGQNVGVLLGEPSGWVVDVDLDVPEAVALGPRFLTKTVRSGRESAPQSHWWYRCEGARTEKWKDVDGQMLVELRSTGSQTVVEPSIHPDGDSYLWHSEPGKSAEIIEIDKDRLLRSCRLLATATLITRRLPPIGGRHDFALALAGFLLREGRFDEVTAMRVMGSAWSVAPGFSEEAERDLAAIIKDTTRNLAEGHEVVGGGRLDEIAPGLPRIIGRWWGWGTPRSERYEGQNVRADSLSGSLRSRGETPPEEGASPGSLEEARARDPRDDRPRKTSSEATTPTTLPVAAPFPIQAMPPECQWLIEEATAALGCAPELVGLPMLAALSSAVGASRIIEIKGGWREGATLFLAAVADPGAMKTPAANVARAPVGDRQRKFQQEYAEKKKDYNREKREWEADKRGLKKGEVAPPEPEAPTMERSWAGDTTFEALVGMLSDNPRGLLVYKDELSGWVRSMDQYRSGGKGSDRQNYLSLWSNDEVIIDRKSQGGEPIILAKPFVSLFGGIQPRMLSALGDGMEDGLMDRFLFGYPERRLVSYSDYELSEATIETYARLYRDLADLALFTDEYGDPNPKPLRLSPEAKDLFRVLVDHLATETIEPGFPARLEGVWSKMRGYTARISLVLACCRSVRENLPERIEVEDVQGAGLLLSYFKAHARRVYSELRAPDPQELLAAELKSLLVEHEGSWVGSATDLYEELEDRDAEGLPENPEWLSKNVLALAARSSVLEAKKGWRKVGGRKGKSERILRLTLKTTVVTVGTVDPTPTGDNSANGNNGNTNNESGEFFSEPPPEEPWSSTNRDIEEI